MSRVLPWRHSWSLVEAMGSRGRWCCAGKAIVGRMWRGSVVHVHPTLAMSQKDTLLETKKRRLRTLSRCAKIWGPSRALTVVSCRGEELRRKPGLLSGTCQKSLVITTRNLLECWTSGDPTNEALVRSVAVALWDRSSFTDSSCGSEKKRLGEERWAAKIFESTFVCALARSLIRDRGLATLTRLTVVTNSKPRRIRLATKGGYYYVQG